MTVDPQYIEMLNKRVEDDLEETHKELQWDAEYSKLKLNKLKNYVKDELEVDTFSVKAIRLPKVQVQTFKVKNLSSYMIQNMLEINKLIEEEKLFQQQ